MSATPTLEQVEHLVQQLPPQEQETLMRRISEQLQAVSQQSVKRQNENQQNYAAQIDAFLAAADALSERIGTQTDSVETLRQIREERMAGINSQ